MEAYAKAERSLREEKACSAVGPEWHVIGQTLALGEGR